MSDPLQAFLQLLAGSDPGERLLEVRYRPPDGQVGMWRRFIPARNLPAAVEFITRQGARTDTYIGVLLRERRHGGRAAVSRSHLLFVEIDRPDALECLRRAPAPPTAVVSSGSAGHAHAYFQLTAPVAIAELEAGNRKLAASIGGDLVSVDGARILRPPSTYSFKHTPPAPVALEVLDRSRVYSYDFLVGGLTDPQPTPTTPPPRGRIARSRVEQDVDEQLRSIGTADYIFRLTGREPTREGKISCPFHHQDRTPSLHAYPDGSWACFGCGKGGTIYDFAGYLYGIETKGRAFLKLRDRLADTFAIHDPPRHRTAGGSRPRVPQPTRVALERPSGGIER